MGNNLKMYRQMLNASMEDVAKATGLSTGAYSDLENGKRPNPTLSTLVKLADYFDVSLDELVGRKNIK